MLFLFFLGRIFFRNTMKWADGKLRSLQKNQLFFPFYRCFGLAVNYQHF